MSREQDIRDALAVLQRELNTPEFAAILAGVPSLDPRAFDLNTGWPLSNEGKPFVGHMENRINYLLEAAASLYDRGITVNTLKENGCDPEYLRGQVELIVRAVDGMLDEDYVKDWLSSEILRRAE